MQRVLCAAAAAAVIGVAAVDPSYPPMPPVCATPNESGKGGDNCGFWSGVLPPLYTGAPVLQNSTKNGHRYLGGTGNDTFFVAHLYSDAASTRDMGFALGSLFPREISDMFTRFESILVNLLESETYNLLPKWLADLVVEKGATAALDIVWDLCEKYIPADITEEWAGIVAGANANGGNATVKNMRRMFLIPQLTKAACTIFTAHNAATNGGHALHLRALDFECKLQVADWSSIVVYHFKNKPMYANFLYIGLIGGTFTGMSYDPKTGNAMTVSEKKWGGHNEFLPWGLPWMTMLREALFLSGPDAVTKYIEGVSKASSATPNTVSIHAGFTFAQPGKPNGATDTSIIFEVGYNYSKKFEWDTQGLDHGKTPQYKDQVYFLKNSGPHTFCAADMMKASYGKYTADYFGRYWTSADMTGDTQIVAFDLTDLTATVANSRKSNVKSGTCCAYHRVRTLVDMKALFDVPAPSPSSP